MTGKIIEKYKVTLDGEEYLYELELLKSGSFKYGNGTCMSITINGKKQMENIDTRYEPDCSPSNFHDFSYNWLKQYVRKEATVERI